MSTETGTFISMDTYEGSIYDPDSLHKYLYANGNPVKYNDPSGNFFSAVEGIVATTINTIADNYRTLQVMGLISGFTKATIAAASGCSPEEITREFIDGYCIGFGVGALMYIAAACTALSIAQIFMLDAGFKSVIYLVLSIVAITTKHPKQALEYYTLSILWAFTFAKLYNLECIVNLYGDKGSLSIEHDYSNSSESDMLEISKNKIKHVLNKHNPKNVAQQLAYNGNEMREISTFFNKDWSESKIQEALNYGYNEAVKKGIITGEFTFLYEGETITIYLENGVFKTGYGNHIYSLEELLELLLGD